MHSWYKPVYLCTMVKYQLKIYHILSKLFGEMCLDFNKIKFSGVIFKYHLISLILLLNYNPFSATYFTYVYANTESLEAVL